MNATKSGKGLGHIIATIASEMGNGRNGSSDLSHAQ
jgi:hypothetical protein